MSASSVILLAEDDDDDFFLLRVALERAGIRNRLFRVTDGREAIRYLEAEAPYADRHAYPLPGLIILDIKMPMLDGFDVLTWLRSRPGLAEIPAVVLSSSDHPYDVETARRLGAKDYRVKPTGLDHLAKILRELRESWLPERGIEDGNHPATGDGKLKRKQPL